jgi:hypothetical protein
MLGKGQVCKAAGVPTPVWIKTGGEIPGVFLRGCRPLWWPSPWWAVLVVVLTQHDGSPAVSKPSDGKEMDFETQVGKGLGGKNPTGAKPGVEALRGGGQNP